MFKRKQQLKPDPRLEQLRGELAEWQRKRHALWSEISTLRGERAGLDKSDPDACARVRQIDARLEALHLADGTTRHHLQETQKRLANYERWRDGPDGRKMRDYWGYS